MHTEYGGAGYVPKRPATTVEIGCLEDLERIPELVCLPVGPRTKRTTEKREWYVVHGFLKATIPLGMFELPITVRNGIPPDEPDFVMSSSGTTVGLIEVTEATNEADQAEMTAFERSKKKVALLGEFGGRFADGASRPGIAWATDIVDAIRRKSGKVIFRSSSAARHLLIYPNSNASMLLSSEEDEREAVDHLRALIAKELTIACTANGCLVHIVGGYLMCLDALSEMTILASE
jgi:hypothetical protein